ncbi:MAG: hypothetical protein ACR2KZ_03415 [Segetibacter sp.]
MSDIILQSTVEKLEALEIALLKKDSKDTLIPEALVNDFNALQNELKPYSSYARTSNNRTDELWLRIDVYANKLAEPVKSNVTHQHQLHKGFWISVGLSVAVIMLLMGWISSCNSKKKCEANDIKYRAIKVTAGKELSKAFYKMDSLYDANPEAVRKQTIQQENRIAEQIKLLCLAGEKEKEAKERRRGQRSK